MQHRAPCPDDPADLSTAWASKLHRIPLSAPHCRFLRLFVVSDNSAQRENVPKATLARRSGFALIASSLPQSGRHVAVLAGQAAAASAFRDETTCPPRVGISLGGNGKPLGTHRIASEGLCAVHLGGAPDRDALMMAGAG